MSFSMQVRQTYVGLRYVAPDSTGEVRALTEANARSVRLHQAGGQERQLTKACDAHRTNSTDLKVIYIVYE